MDALSASLVTTAGVTAGVMFALWLVSLWLRDASIIDLFWGPGFVLIAWVALGYAPDDEAGSVPLRRALVVGLTSLWGLRLGLHLALRNWGHGEDPRYQAMRRHHGERFPWISALTVFGLQGVLMWFISLPVQFTVASPSGAPLGLLDALGVSLWLIGFSFEVVGDWQLTRFRADPSQAGKVLSTGLWAWTRHPNYFGDAVQWWGLFAFAAAVGPMGWATVGSPLAMNFLLRRVSGVTLLERGMRKRKPDYARYIETTPAFLPRPPQRSRGE